MNVLGISLRKNVVMLVDFICLVVVMYDVMVVGLSVFGFIFILWFGLNR